MTDAAQGEPVAGLRHVALLGAATSIHLQRWALALQAAGLRVSVVSQHRAGALPLPAAIGCHWLPFGGPAGYLLNGAPLRRLLRGLAPDLLHAHYASGYGSTARLARWRPLLLSVWGSDVYDFPRRGPLQRGLLRRNLAAADAIASTSHAMAREVLRWWPGADVAVTPFGVDTERFMPGAAPRDDGAGGTVIGTVKTLAPTYGIDTLVRAFARLAADGTRLLIVGDGPDRAALEALAVELGVAARVRFVGPVAHADVPRWLAQMDLYVAASRNESFGVAVVEAMACGLPVVVSDAGGLPEVVGDAGVIVPRDDPAALAAVLDALVADAPRRTALGRAARARAVAEYGWPRCVERMLDCQRAVVARAA